MEIEMIPKDKLPIELWFYIFSNLPAKLLLTVRCVSKTWRSFIDNPNFINTHLHEFKNNSDKHFLLSWEIRPSLTGWEQFELKIRLRTMGKFRKREEILGFPFSPNDVDYQHNGYVNGVLLFTQSSMTQTKLILFNPSIRKLMFLPPFPPSPVGRAEFVIGYDPFRNDHKVVVIFLPFRLPEDDFPDMIAVFEFGTGCWRVKSGIEVPDRWYLGDKVFLKGFMHWLSFDLMTAIEQGKSPKNKTHIVSFDFVSEEFRYTGLPGDRGDECQKITIPFVLGDSLAVFDVSSDRACVWVMRKCGGDGMDCWSKWFDKASDSVIYEFFLEHKYHVKNFLYVEKIGKYMFEVNGEVKSYDMENHKMKDLETCHCCHLMYFEGCRCRYVMDPYIESLLLSSPLGGIPLTSILQKDTDVEGWT